MYVCIKGEDKLCTFVIENLDFMFNCFCDLGQLMCSDIYMYI